MKLELIFAATLGAFLSFAGGSQPLPAQTGPATFTTRITGYAAV